MLKKIWDSFFSRIMAVILRNWEFYETQPILWIKEIKEGEQVFLGNNFLGNSYLNNTKNEDILRQKGKIISPPLAMKNLKKNHFRYSYKTRFQSILHEPFFKCRSRKVGKKIVFKIFKKYRKWINESMNRKSSWMRQNKNLTLTIP